MHVRKALLSTVVRAGCHQFFPIVFNQQSRPSITITTTNRIWTEWILILTSSLRVSSHWLTNDRRVPSKWIVWSLITTNILIDTRLLLNNCKISLNWSSLLRTNNWCLCFNESNELRTSLASLNDVHCLNPRRKRAHKSRVFLLEFPSVLSVNFILWTKITIKSCWLDVIIVMRSRWEAIREIFFTSARHLLLFSKKDKTCPSLQISVSNSCFFIHRLSRWVQSSEAKRWPCVNSFSNPKLLIRVSLS